MALKIFNPSAWLPNTPGNYALNLANGLFEVQTGNQSWSLHSTDNNAIRFELRDGDTFRWDASVSSSAERTEIADKQVIANGTPLQISYGFNLEPGEPNTAFFMALGQLHQDNYPGALPWGPPFNFSLDGERLGIDIKYSDANGNPVSKRIFTDVADIQRGHFYDIDIKAVFDPSGENGRLVVTRDGVIIADYAGPLGYVQQNGVYWKEGIYRHANATETVSAVYKDLSITTGDAVVFPDKSAFIDAPVVTVGAVTDVAGSGPRTFSLSGTAKAGTTVTLTEDGVVVGTAKVDAAGHFEMALKVNSVGTHIYDALATDATGRNGIAAVPLRLEIGTSAQIVAKMGDLSKDPGLASIVLTDTNVLVLQTKTQMSTFMKAYGTAMDKIEGGYSFLVTSKIVGVSGYDRQDEAFDDHGVLTERLRYSGTKLVYDETIVSATVRTLETWKSDGTSDFSQIVNGVATLYKQFDAGGHVTFAQTIAGDGTKQIDYFNTSTGALTSTKVYKPNGERTETTLGITGANYTKQAFTFDKTGKLVAQERFNEAGVTITSKVWLPDGSVESHNFTAGGKETSFSIVQADGSRAEGTLSITGQPYASQVIYYGKTGVMTTRERYDGEQHVLTLETFGSGASVKTYSYDAGTGALTGWTTKLADKSFTVSTVYAGTEKVASIVSYDTSGKMVSKTFLDQAGNKIADPAGQPDAGAPATGEGSTYSYDAAGQKIGVTIKAADGSMSVVKFAAGRETVYQHVDKYAASGQLTSTENYDRAGNLSERSTFKANGDVLTQRFDASGKLIGQTSLHDNVRDESDYAVTGKPYTKQEASYDASDNLLWMKRAYANGNPAFDQTIAADGSQVVKQWNAAGLLTLTKVGSDGKVNEVDQFNLAGVKTVAEIRNTDGSREWHYFDAKTGAETNSVTTYADKSRVEANYAITGKDYVQQIATYDAKGGLVDLVRKHGDATHTLAFEQKVNADGSAEVHNYDLVGRETSSVITAADKSRDAFQMTYAGNDKLPATTLQTHYTAANVKQWTDLTKADGSHLQTAFTDGAKLASHANVVDTFVGADSGHDTFSFAAHFGKDTIAGFQAAKAGGGDTIEFDTGLVADYSHLVAAMTAQGADTLIKISDTDTLLIKGVAPTSLSGDDFRFVHHDVLAV